MSAMTPLETVRQSYQLSKAGDRDGFLSLFANDVELIEAECLPYGGVHKGIDGFKALLGELRKYYSKMAPDPQIFTEGGEWVMVYCDLTLTAAGTGRTTTIPLVERFQVVDGKIRLMHPIYSDTAAVLDLLGMERSPA